MTLREVVLIAAEAGVDLRTVKRVLGDGHRATLAIRTCICMALVTREHSKLARALERDGVLPSQRDASWDRPPGRPLGTPESKPRKPYRSSRRTQP